MGDTVKTRVEYKINMMKGAIAKCKACGVLDEEREGGPLKGPIGMLMRIDVQCPLLTIPMKVKLLKPQGIARNQHGAYSDREEQELAPKRKALVSLNGIRRRCNARMFSQPH